LVVLPVGLVLGLVAARLHARHVIAAVIAAGAAFALIIVLIAPAGEIHASRRYSYRVVVAIGDLLLVGVLFAVLARRLPGGTPEAAGRRRREVRGWFINPPPSPAVARGLFVVSLILTIIHIDQTSRFLMAWRAGLADVGRGLAVSPAGLVPIGSAGLSPATHLVLWDWALPFMSALVHPIGRSQTIFYAPTPGYWPISCQLAQAQASGDSAVPQALRHSIAEYVCPNRPRADSHQPFCSVGACPGNG
jgi:hypothetical protein